MSHDHDHDDPAAYYWEQLASIGICGALGVVCVLLWVHNLPMLKLLLVPRFHIWVLLGGVGLLTLVVVRGLAVWVAVGKLTPHHHDHGHEHDHVDAHDHAHAHDHNHDHAHDHSHSHGSADHGHEHGWSPWRYAFLLLPVVLYCLDLPNKALILGPREIALDDAGKSVTVKGGKVTLGFKELKEANSEYREELEGMIGKIKGQYVPSGNDKMFSLVRMKMRCCAADAVPADVVIITPEPISNLKSMDWVEVEGVIQFRKRSNRKEIVPVLQVQSMNKITPSNPEADIYIQ